jgi:Penicillin amidase
VSLEADKLYRILGLKRTSEISTKGLPDEVKALSQSFVNGINHAAKDVLILPIEFYLAGIQFYDFEVSDILAIIKFISFYLDGSKIISRYIFSNEKYSLKRHLWPIKGYSNARCRIRFQRIGEILPYI